MTCKEIKFDCPGNCRPCVGLKSIYRKQSCGKKTTIIPINFQGIQVKTLDNLSCSTTEDKNQNIFVLETEGYTPWCNPGCCQLRQCIEGKLVWILPLEDPYYFYDNLRLRFWKSESGICTKIRGSRGDLIVDSLTGDIYKLTDKGWINTSSL